MVRRFVIGLLLVDIPVMATLLVIGWPEPWDEAMRWYRWREAHPWVSAVTLPAAVVLMWRIRTSRNKFTKSLQTSRQDVI